KRSPMKYCFFLSLLFFISFSCSIQKQEEKQSSLYLGQVAPDSIPQVFMKGIISVPDRFDMGLAIAPDNSSLVFGVADPTRPEETCLYLMHLKDGEWSKPDKSFLSNNVNTFFPMFDPAGKKLYFAKSDEDKDTDLWVARFENKQALNPQPLDSLINSPYREAGQGRTLYGDFYFTSNRDRLQACCGDIYYYGLDSIGSPQVQKETTLSTPFDEESFFLSPEGDFIIIQAWKPEFESKHDLYISYRNKEGSWTTPERLNSSINSPAIEQRPFVTYDNQFLFFSRTSTYEVEGQTQYESDIYWLSTRSIFHPYPYHTQFERSVKYGQAFQIKFPGDIFRDVDDIALTYQLTRGDGFALPEGFTFDAETLTFQGQWHFKKNQTFRLTSSDPYGNFGVFVFEMGDASL
ncbi:MAG: putative Ig domain-containing protein, partial [Bacteroidota bacterium]